MRDMGPPRAQLLLLPQRSDTSQAPVPTCQQGQWHPGWWLHSRYLQVDARVGFTLFVLDSEMEFQIQRGEIPVRH